MDYYVMLALGMAFGLAIAAMAGAIGQSLVTQRAIDGLVRQPEVKVWVMILMVLGLAFIESLVIYCMVISFTLAGDPFKDAVKDMAGLEMGKTPAITERVEK
ncbi:MAG: ATP synthase F0 subunit C [Candidatus Hydrogenedentota bacterium]